MKYELKMIYWVLLGLQLTISIHSCTLSTTINNASHEISSHCK